MSRKLQIFMIKKTSILDFNHTFLATISLDSALKKDDSYYPHVFLKECKYIEKKVVWHVHDSLSDFLILLMSLMKNSFSFNERAKTFLFFKILTSLDCKEVLFTTLRTSYPP